MNKLDTGEIVCGFGVRKDYEGQKDWDENYKEVTIKKRLKKIGDGENDYIEEEYEDVKYIPIKEVLAAQIDDVGIESFLKPYKMQGVDLLKSFDTDVSKEVVDFSQFPEDPKLSQDVYRDMMRTFMSMDPALRGDCRTPEEFLSKLTSQKIDAYIQSKMPKNEEKGEK